LRDKGQGLLLQCVAVCCSVLQCVAVCCSVQERDKLPLERQGAGPRVKGWLRSVGSLKLQVSFAKEPCKKDDILQNLVS